MGVIRAMGKAGQSLVDASRFQIFHRPAVGPRGLACWVALPEVPGPQAPLVAVHGISRNALEMVRLLAPLCQRTGRAVIVPCFDGQGWKNYQQVVKPKRADLALLQLLDDLEAEGFCNARQFEMFGYSGGAQFSHRFAMLYPHRVMRLVLGAAGWYTMPRADLAFPLGIGDKTRRRAAATIAAGGSAQRSDEAVKGNGSHEPGEGGVVLLRPEAGGWGPHFARSLPHFLRLPMDVAVGAKDNCPDAATRRNARLDAEQGVNRLDRAGAWVGAVREMASRMGQRADVRLHTLPDCGHSFRQCVLKGGLLDLIAGERCIFSDHAAAHGLQRNMAARAGAERGAVLRVAAGS